MNGILLLLLCVCDLSDIEFQKFSKVIPSSFKGMSIFVEQGNLSFHIRLEV